MLRAFHYSERSRTWVLVYEDGAQHRTNDQAEADFFADEMPRNKHGARLTDPSGPCDW
jgi:hypothetical protein